MKKNKPNPSCVHQNIFDCCLSCKLDYLKENKDKVITGGELLDIVNLVLEEIQYVENHVDEVEEKCPEHYDPQRD